MECKSAKNYNYFSPEAATSFSMTSATRNTVPSSKWRPIIIIPTGNSSE